MAPDATTLRPIDCARSQGHTPPWSRAIRISRPPRSCVRGSCPRRSVAVPGSPRTATSAARGPDPPTECESFLSAKGTTTQGGTAMLVLSRKLGERVLVPQCGLSITVVAVEGNLIRLGFTAPSEVGVYREEVWQRIGSEDQPRVRLG